MTHADEEHEQRVRDWIAERFFDPDDGMPNYNDADQFIGELYRFGYNIVPNYLRDSVSGPEAFVLDRAEDETGVSGTGVVAEGVEFTDGTVALRWTSAWPTSVVFHDRGMESVQAVHGHGGKTKVRYV